MLSLLLVATPVQAKDTECIRKVVWAEARGETKRGQEAVAQVIVNRSRQSGRPVCKVVRERGQFVMGNPPQWFRITLPSKDPTNGATHFRTKDMPMWLGLRKLIRIGGHTFYGR